MEDIPPSIRKFIFRGVLPLVCLLGLLSGAVGALLVSWQQGSRIANSASLVVGVGSPDTPFSLLTPPAPQVERSEEAQTIAVVNNVSPAVVSILISKEVSTNAGAQRLFPFDDFFGFGGNIDGQGNVGIPSPNSGGTSPKNKQEVGGGTGVIVRSDGLIVTNKHVVDDEKAEYTVMTNDGKRYSAKVIARDPLGDIGMIKIEAQNLTIARLGDSSTVKIGQTVIAIGNTLSQYRNTVTKGVVSGIGRRVVAGGSQGESEVIEEAIQTDAAINPGNSGGPLVDLSGTVIGINTAINREGQLIGFAIPINGVKQVVNTVEKIGRIVRPWLGVRYTIIDEEFAKANNIDVGYGALLVHGDARQDMAVIAGSPADMAGLKENDIILEIDGQRITVDRPLSAIVVGHEPGDRVVLQVRTKGTNRMVTVTLSEYK